MKHISIILLLAFHYSNVAQRGRNYQFGYLVIALPEVVVGQS